MTRVVLVPLDHSALSERALPAAEAAARALGASLLLAYAPRGLPPYSELALLAQTAADDDAAGLAYLGAVADQVRARSGLDVRTRLLDFPVADAICRAAADAGAELIVMCTHGRTGWSRLWIGSVADAVVRHALVPVWLVRASDATVAAPRDGARVLLPLDGSAFAEEVLTPATALLDAFEPTYRLARVVTPVVTAEYAGSAIGMPPVFLPDEPATDKAWRAADAYLTATADRLRAERPGRRVETLLLAHDSPAHALVDAALDADLVAMATHGRGASRLLLGSVSDKVLHGAHGSLLLFRPTAAVRGAEAAWEQGTVAGVE